MRTDFIASKMLADAERQTSRSDWGDPLFRELFEVLLRDLNGEAHLHAEGVVRTQRRLKDILCSVNPSFPIQPRNHRFYEPWSAEGRAMIEAEVEMGV